jgi:hypothetical protein
MNRNDKEKRCNEKMLLLSQAFCGDSKIRLSVGIFPLKIFLE